MAFLQGDDFENNKKLHVLIGGGVYVYIDSESKYAWEKTIFDNESVDMRGFDTNALFP